MTFTTGCYDTYAPLAGNYSESSLTIEWQLFDVLTEELVYKNTTAGYGKQKGIGYACMVTAFRSALDNLLADARFVAAAKTSGHELWRREAESLVPIGIVRRGDDHRMRLPEDIDAALESILIVRAGASTGSGAVISPEGYALTAAHLVSGLKKVVVRLHSGLELTAVVVRVDRGQDVALIKLPGRGYSCLAIATESVPEVGTAVLAIGAPEGPAGKDLPFTVTKGIVSALREWQGTHYLQTDAALNHGNSGGPILSPDGKVVAIVSWKIAAPDVEGLSFGVPIYAIADRLAISWQ